MPRLSKLTDFLNEIGKFNDEIDQNLQTFSKLTDLPILEECHEIFFTLFYVFQFKKRKSINTAHITDGCRRDLVFKQNDMLQNVEYLVVN